VSDLSSEGFRFSTSFGVETANPINPTSQFLSLCHPAKIYFQASGSVSRVSATWQLVATVFAAYNSCEAGTANIRCHARERACCVDIRPLALFLRRHVVQVKTRHVVVGLTLNGLGPADAVRWRGSSDVFGSFACTCCNNEMSCGEE
jgi:hypothetical protein